MYRVIQMMPAASGMYLVDTRQKVTVLVVMWVLAEYKDAHMDAPEQQIIGLTTEDLSGDLEDALKSHWGDNPSFSTQKIDGYRTIR